jgi:MFS family permease
VEKTSRKGLSTQCRDRRPKRPARFVQTGFMKALFITLMIQALVSAAVLGPTVIAPVIAPAMGLPGSSVGIYIAMVYVGAICATLYSGTLISKWGPIRASQAGLLWCASGLALIATGIVGLAMIGSVLVGFGYGPITPASSHILIRTTPQHRLSTMFSIKQTGVPLGGVMVGLMIPPQELAFGWRWAILSVSAGCLLMAAIGQFVRSEFDTGRAQHVAQSLVNGVLGPIRLVASHPGLRVMAGCSFLFSGVQLAVTAYIPTYLNLDLSWSLLAAGLAVSAAQIAGMAGRIFWGAVADMGLGAHRTLALLTALMALGCIGTAMLTRETGDFWVFAVLIVFGACAVGWNGVYLAEVARIAPPGKAGMSTGGTLAFTFLGVVFWPPIFGQIAELTGSYRASYVAFCLPLLFCLVFFLRRRRPEKETP